MKQLLPLVLLALTTPAFATPAHLPMPEKINPTCSDPEASRLARALMQTVAIRIEDTGIRPARLNTADCNVYWATETAPDMPPPFGFPPALSCGVQIHVRTQADFLKLKSFAALFAGGFTPVWLGGDEGKSLSAMVPICAKIYKRGE